jgi:hypothetical protein
LSLKKLSIKSMHDYIFHMRMCEFMSGLRWRGVHTRHAYMLFSLSSCLARGSRGHLMARVVRRRGRYGGRFINLNWDVFSSSLATVFFTLTMHHGQQAPPRFLGRLVRPLRHHFASARLFPLSPPPRVCECAYWCLLLESAWVNPCDTRHVADHKRRDGVAPPSVVGPSNGLFNRYLDM